MIWGAFVGCELFELKFIEKKNNSQTYTDMFEDALLPFLDEDLVFMHDNASIHSSEHTKKWLKDNNIEVLE